jgi:hypothetical protein
MSMRGFSPAHAEKQKGEATVLRPLSCTQEIAIEAAEGLRGYYCPHIGAIRGWQFSAQSRLNARIGRCALMMAGLKPRSHT